MIDKYKLEKFLAVNMEAYYSAAVSSPVTLEVQKNLARARILEQVLELLKADFFKTKGNL